MITARRARGIEAAAAYEALKEFARDYGRLPLLLLVHAAVPQSFWADLLNLIKVNFVGEAGSDLSVDADVLFSPVVEGFGAGYYRMDPEIRRQSLMLLDAHYKHGRERRRIAVARFLLTYVLDVERQPRTAADPLLAEHLATEREVAMAFIDPGAAAARLAHALAEPQRQPAAARFQLDSMAAALSLPLSGFPELLIYARGIGALQSGQNEEAERLLGLLGDTPVGAGGITLRPASEVLRARSSAAPTTEPVRAPSPAIRGQIRAGRATERPAAPIGEQHRTEEFEFDVFISYAPTDEASDPRQFDSGILDEVDEARKWITEFRRNLGIALRLRLGREIRIYSDESQLVQHTELSATSQALQRSAVFLALCSPTYLRREWTRRKLQLFLEVAGTERVVAADLAPITVGDLPAPLRSVLRYRFWVADEANIPRRLMPGGGPGESERDLGAAYARRVQDLAAQISRILRPPEAGDQTVADPTSGQLTVVLAEVGDALYDEREQMRAFLGQLGVTVFPRIPYSRSGSEFARGVEYDLEHADLFVQLLGPLRSDRVPGMSESIARFQYSAAVRRGVPILQWRSPTLDLHNVTHEDRSLLDGPRVMVASFTEFQREIGATLAVLRSKPLLTATQRPKEAFITCDMIDRGSTSLELLRKNLELCGLAWRLPLYAEQGRVRADDIRQDFETNVLEADAILVYFGQCSLAWVRAQLSAIRKLMPRRQHAVPVALCLDGPNPGVLPEETDLIRVQMQYLTSPAAVAAFLPQVLANGDSRPAT
jgi:hypothetical protein